jgi:hypothetical protein
MERREHARMPITLPCEVEFLRSGLLQEGQTENLSRNGALIHLTAPAADFVIGDAVTVRIQLPPRAFFEQKCMTCSGVITRIETAAGPARVFAFEIASVQFESAERMLMRAGARAPEVTEHGHVQ